MTLGFIRNYIRLMVEVGETVKVWVYFSGNQIQPFIFFWKNRRIKIEAINLVHTAKKDGQLVYYFSVSSESNFYQLRFESQKLKWFLEKVEED